MSISCQTKEPVYRIETNLGTIKVKLYEKTPLHRANFEKLVEEGVYDSLAFHRIIQGFMIQGGDVATGKNPADTSKYDYMVPAEFVPEYFHKKGALAAARMGDDVNPEKASSSTQFYIVQGHKFTDEELFQIEDRFGHTFPDFQRGMYKMLGGAPHLDGNYTVFGEVTEGLDVVDKIAAVPTDMYDRPRADVRIIRIVKD
jgi:peptidyl-prolyl cis-trans isomerase B (cyclophilin B)